MTIAPARVSQSDWLDDPWEWGGRALSRPFSPAQLLCRSAVGDWRSVTAEVEDVLPDGLAVLVEEPVVGGQTVSVRWNQVERRAVVQICQRRGSRFLLVLRIVYHERRRQERLATGGNATLRWGDHTGMRVATVRVSNATPDGLQVESGEALNIEQPVQVLGADWECVGRVRYCRPQGAGFQVGMQLLQPPRVRKSSVGNYPK